MEEHQINLLDNFIGGWYNNDNSFCDELIEYFNNPKTEKHRGKVLYNNSEIEDNAKQSTDTCLDKNHFHLYMKQTQKCLDKYIAKYPASNFFSKFGVVENVNLQYYKPNESFNFWHTERNSAAFPYSTRHLVFMTYLNDVTDGGETEFLHQKVKVKPEKGLTLIWPADWTFTHRGVPSKTQEKYIVTGWFNFI